MRNNCAGSCVSHSPSCPVRKSCSTCSFVIGCLWTIGLAFPSSAFFFQMALRTLFAASNAGSDNGPRLVYWWLFKVSFYCCSYCTERRNFEIFSVFLLHCCIKILSGSHLDLLCSSLLSEFQTLFGLKTIL